jgi:hypothetical protein
MMRAHRRAVLILSFLLIAPASSALAQDRGGIRTETQERMAPKFDTGLLWNLLGLLGAFGLLGLRRGHSEDSYHPTGFE